MFTIKGELFFAIGQETHHLIALLNLAFNKNLRVCFLSVVLKYAHFLFNSVLANMLAWLLAVFLFVVVWARPRGHNEGKS